MSATGSNPPADDALISALVTLAGTPDHRPSVDSQLAGIAKLTADRVAAARFASVTAIRGKAYTTVAVSDELVRAIDEAQYADEAGPCLEALAGSAPVGVPDIGATVQWPGFHEAAPRMGLHASVSVPLFTGRGHAVAALNVYSDDPVALAPLIAGISSVHSRAERGTGGEEDLSALDDGGRGLVIGYAQALTVRATVQLAIELIRAADRSDADDAYFALCLRADQAGTDLAEAAAAVIRRRI